MSGLLFSAFSVASVVIALCIWSYFCWVAYRVFTS